MEDAIASYEAAVAHVMVVTDDSHARHAALESNDKVAAFYRKHGVTAEAQARYARLADMFAFQLWQVGDPEFQPR